MGVGRKEGIVLWSLMGGDGFLFGDGEVFLWISGGLIYGVEGFGFFGVSGVLRIFLIYLACFYRLV